MNSGPLVFGSSLVPCHKDYRLVLSFLESKVTVGEYDWGQGIRSESTFFHSIADSAEWLYINVAISGSWFRVRNPKK